MVHQRIPRAAFCLVLGVIVLPLAASVTHAGTPVVTGQRAAPDPVGNYEWSLTMATMQNTQVNGTLSITRTDSALAATLTSDNYDGKIAAKSVTQDGDTVTVVAEGDFGWFTLVLDFSEQEPRASFKYVGPNGETDQGPVSIKRVNKH